jgi:hypothetical protein
MTRTTLIASLFWLPALASEATAQRLTPEPRGVVAQALFTITGQIGKHSLQASGNGVCRHAPDASIRGVSASLWAVEYAGSEGELEQLALTLWRPKDGGPDQLSLRLETDSRDHRIETGGGRKRKGEAEVTIIPNGLGGRLELKGKEAGGKAIQLTIECPTFATADGEDTEGKTAGD